MSTPTRVPRTTPIPPKHEIYTDIAPKPVAPLPSLPNVPGSNVPGSIIPAKR